METYFPRHLFMLTYAWLFMKNRNERTYETFVRIGCVREPLPAIPSQTSRGYFHFYRIEEKAASYGHGWSKEAAAPARHPASTSRWEKVVSVRWTGLSRTFSFFNSCYYAPYTTRYCRLHNTRTRNRHAPMIHDRWLRCAVAPILYHLSRLSLRNAILIYFISYVFILRG